MGKIIHVNTIIAHHLVFMGYGHWLSNDPRGSGSTETRAKKLESLGDIHFGRKKIQPSRAELRAFYEDAKQKLEFETLWFDERVRQVIADAFGDIARKRGYTIWASAVLQNHAHQIVRVHRDSGDIIWEQMAIASRDALRAAGLVPKDHPVWWNRPYDVYKTTIPLVRKAIGYVEDNFEKHGLKREIYPWIIPYDGWPLHKGKR